METKRASGRDRFMSQINVTPLVDVMLVLLIIFMVTAPMMQEGIDVNLPRVEAAAITHDEEPLVITVDRARRIYIGGAPVRTADLKEKLSAINKIRPGRMVLLKADEAVPYGAVVSTMADIRKAGIDKIGMATEPGERR